MFTCSPSAPPIPSVPSPPPTPPPLQRLLFEAAEGGGVERLRRLVLRCQQVGVSLSERPNIRHSELTQ
ncbi:hypothetical protein EYF80_031114 [Liparis tanakae]|uniref:Uncharacterized protein n=1 Tax=Liparis tanakae TaxID=230148 RepID=A0A4Z2GZM8_9TELE|nr:hypothetical protein EYF80_031114 [Liparis tanakae]